MLRSPLMHRADELFVLAALPLLPAVPINELPPRKKAVWVWTCVSALVIYRILPPTLGFPFDTYG